MKRKDTHIDWRIFRKAVVNQMNSEEEELFDAWLQASKENRKYFEKAVIFYEKQNRMEAVEEKDYMPAFERFLKQVEPQRKFKLWHLQVAASIVVLVVSVVIVYMVFNRDVDYQELSKASPIEPAKGKVELVLSTGKKVLLEQEGDSSIQETEGEIRKKEGTVDYLAFQQAEKKEIQYNTVNVPRGTDFKVVLSDSTVVWLNAESSLRYPVQFAGNVRKVAISGEAYFDVTPNKAKPFVVEVGNTQVKVLGTEFNINAYRGDEGTYTTLVEGKVSVNNGLGKNVIIHPSEQAITSAAPDVDVRKVDVNQVIDWRQGLFDFEDEKLVDILDELARWYDLKVFFESEELKEYEFTGGIKRYENLNQMLELFELTKSVKFYIKDNVILVQKY